MLKLTKKNYNDLPEVRTKREQEDKKNQLKQRMQRVKEHEAKRRELIKQHAP